MRLINTTRTRSFKPVTINMIIKRVVRWTRFEFFDVFVSFSNHRRLYNYRRRHLGRFHQTVHRCRRDKNRRIYLTICLAIYRKSFLNFRHKHLPATSRKHKIPGFAGNRDYHGSISPSRPSEGVFFLTTRTNTYRRIRNCLSHLRLYDVDNGTRERNVIITVRFFV